MRLGVRHIVVFSLLFVLLSSISIAQNLMMRGYPITSGGGAKRGDFNQDGVPDIVFRTATGVSVALGNALGTLGTIKSTSGSIANVAGELSVANFTSSGHLDLALSHFDSVNPVQGTIDILLGKGDGTFRLGQVLLAPGGTAPFSITTADFNGDGNTDIAVISGTTVYMILGNGNGTFRAPQAVSGTTLNNDVGSLSVRVGDFDGDGRPDLAIGNASRLSVLFNNGSLSFKQLDVITNATFLSDFAPADVNQDGYTDLLVGIQGECPPNGPCAGGYSVYTSLGKSRGFHLTFNEVPQLDGGIAPPFGLMAVDVDGDGINDIVGLESVTKTELFVRKGLAGGSFDSTALFFAPGDYSGGGDLVSLDLNRDGRPDFVILDSVDSVVETMLNAFPRSACAGKTQSPSVTVCQPTNGAYVKSPVHFVAKAFDSSHPITALQVYVDYKLLRNVHANSLDTQIPLSLGAHLIVAKAWDSSGASFRSERQFNVYSGVQGQVCSAAPSTLTICAPAQSASVTSPVRVFAAANANWIVTSFQVYIDSKLVSADSKSNYIDRSFALSAGTHKLTVKSFDANGNIISQSRSVLVH